VVFWVHGAGFMYTQTTTEDSVASVGAVVLAVAGRRVIGSVCSPAVMDTILVHYSRQFEVY
jgi:hypothetical protein